MGPASSNKIVVVVRKTRLEELVHRFNTRDQARFYLVHNKLDFDDYQREHDTYHASLATLTRSLSTAGGGEYTVQLVDRGFLPNFVFDGVFAVVAVGQDGMVANTAKYVGTLPLLGVNPDRGRWDGILLPWDPVTAAGAIAGLRAGKARTVEVTMAEARLSDGQRIRAFNDLLIGRRDHVSSRYAITLGGRTEVHSSSGILVSTGAGSTGWLSSVRNMAAAVARALGAPEGLKLQETRTAWDDPRLWYVVREPFAAKGLGTSLAAGRIEKGQTLKLESRMPEGGWIYGDGIDADGVAFNSGVVAEIRASEQRTRLVIP